MNLRLPSPARPRCHPHGYPRSEQNLRAIPGRRANAQLPDQCTRRRLGSFQSTPAAGTEPRPASPGPCPVRFQALATPRARPARLRAHALPPPRPPVWFRAGRIPGRLSPRLARGPCSRSARRFPILAPAFGCFRDTHSRSGHGPGPFQTGPGWIRAVPSPSGWPAQISCRAPLVFRPHSRVSIGSPDSGSGSGPPFMRRHNVTFTRL
jgi:hypothetical protein